MIKLSKDEHKIIESIAAPSEFLSDIEKFRIEKTWIAARDYYGKKISELGTRLEVKAGLLIGTEEREGVLREALQKIGHGFSWDNQEEGCQAATEMVEVADAALAASKEISNGG